MSDVLTPSVVQKLFDIYNIVWAWELTSGGASGTQDPRADYINDLKYCIANLGNPDWSSVVSKTLTDNFWDNPFINKWDTHVNIYLLEYIVISHNTNKSALNSYAINGSM